MSNYSRLIERMNNCHYILFRPYIATGTAEQKVELKSLIYEIKSEAPFDAMGLFTVDLSTITSVLSTVMTYLVIMVQFNVPPPPSPSANAEKNMTEDSPL